MSYLSYAVLQFAGKTVWERVKEAALDLTPEIDILAHPDQILEGRGHVVCVYNWVNHFPDCCTVRDFMRSIGVAEDAYGGERWGEAEYEYELYGQAPLLYDIEWVVHI